jgi:hypothetical protein
VTVGEPVEIQVALENTSLDDMAVAKSRAPKTGELDFDVDVVSATGDPVPLTRYGRALHGERTNPIVLIHRSPKLVTVKPSEKLVETVLLTKIYELTPGDYIVSVAPNEMSVGSAPKILSNALRLTILPSAPGS